MSGKYSLELLGTWSLVIVWGGNLVGLASPNLTQSAPASLAGPGAALQERIDRGPGASAFEPGFGYLRAVLQAAEIPETSQLLVFSKTSCQRERISPKTPRAIYFNDRAYVAWVQGSALLELSLLDPQSGAVFYTLEQNAGRPPLLIRRDQCLECHTSRQTLNVPGYVVRSYATDTNGVIDITDGWSMVDHRTPWPERWGGWYVDQPVGLGQSASLANAGSASSNVDLSRYLQPGSDLVALLVLQHQAHMQNLLTQLRVAANAPATSPEAWKNSSETVVRYLLFADETPLGAPVKSGSAFAKWFENAGPRDSQGRSLRELDLQTRLFRYPCSYMIYSPGFDALPRAVQLHLYSRLGKILRGEDSDPAYASLAPATRRAILEILIATKPEVPIAWKL